MLTSRHRFFFTAGWMHQARANIREMPGAEHRHRNLRRTEAREMLWYPLRVSSFLPACGKTTHAAALPPCREKKATGQKLLLELSSRPPWGQTAWATVVFGERGGPVLLHQHRPTGTQASLSWGLCFVPCSPTRLLSQKWDFSPTAKVSCSWFNINFGNLHPDSEELPYPGIRTAALRSSPISGDRVCFVWQYGFNEQAARHWEPFPSNSCKINDGTFSSAMLQPPKIPL